MNVLKQLSSPQRAMFKDFGRRYYPKSVPRFDKEFKMVRRTQNAALTVTRV